MGSLCHGVPSLACGTLPFSPACRPLFSPQDWPPVPESQGTAPARVSQAGIWAGVSDDLCGSHSAVLLWVQLPCFSRWRWGPTDWADLLAVRWLPRVGSFSPSQLPIRNAGPVLIPSLSFFFLWFYPVLSRVSCPLWRFKSFCQHQLMFCVSCFTWGCGFVMCLWGRWARPLTPLPSCSASPGRFSWIWQ